MANFEYAAHITFILHKGAWVPWHVAFTSTFPPFKTISIGLDTEKLMLYHDELHYNYNVNNFPRPDGINFDYICKEFEFPETIKHIYNNLKPSAGSWDVVIGAVDNATYMYLKDIIPNIILINFKPLSEEITLGVAYRKYELEKGWHSE